MQITLTQQKAIASLERSLKAAARKDDRKKVPIKGTKFVIALPWSISHNGGQFKLGHITFTVKERGRVVEPSHPIPESWGLELQEVVADA